MIKSSRKETKLLEALFSVVKAGLTVLVHFFILRGGLVPRLDRCGAGVGGVGVLGDSTDSDSSDGGVLLSILGEVTPAVD